ncbi:MFS transporter [Sphingobacterium sp. N143]|uniref:MFS transporter n=1 Tax=Sphingobacterium sp. N143 TaxID=2746727 RepID=UPI0025773AD4|nr:MFS transporter [Sphingobacterium sp. N143]MDM1295804.1 MFS transporter [Sphingobacterium sp. N143]
MKATAKLPLVALLALTVSGFIAIITETLPAGLLPQISAGIGVSEAYAGQFITLYALGSVLSAIPVISWTRNWNRKPLLLAAVAGFFIFNLITFFLQSYYFLLAVRFMAGISAGIIWGVLTGYTVRMVPPALAGKALAIVGVGQPIALSLGVPLATWLGKIIGWNMIFLSISLLSLLLMFWIIALVPDFAVEKKTSSTPFSVVFLNKAVQRILLTTVCWILAHNLLYTYIAPILQSSNLSGSIDLVLLLFGLVSILGIWLTGYFIDRYLKKMVIINLLLFCVAAILLWLGTVHMAFALVGIALWGYSFGGAPTLLQKDLADVAKEQVDIAQAIFVTVFNIAVAAGGLLGGVLLEYSGIGYLFSGAVLLSLVSLSIAANKR